MLDKFRNSRVLVRDIENRKVVVDTVIISHDADSNVIVINADSVKFSADKKYSILVLYKNMVYEYLGILRNEHQRLNSEFAIFSERKKEDRAYARYDVESEGYVTSITSNLTDVELKRKIRIKVKNISANGILFVSESVSFGKNDVITINMGINGSDFVSKYQVVRTQNSTSASIEYGCRMFMPDEVPKIFRPSKVRASKLESGNDYLPIVEEKCGYSKILNKIKDTVWYDSLAEEIVELAKDADVCALLNCIHQKRNEDEALERNCLNVCIMFVWMFSGVLPNEEDTLISIVKSILKYKLQNENLEDDTLSFVNNMIAAAEQYDMRAAHPTTKEACIPLGTIEQMWNQGKSVPAGNPRFAGLILAKFILENIKGREAVLNDGSLVLVMNIPTNDIIHPLIVNSKISYQLENANDLRWVIV